MTENATPHFSANDPLEQKALTEVNAGHYKEAIALYKKLLQQEDKEEWNRQLAYCYLLRAKSFAARHMIKEALVLWETYSQHAQPPYQDYDHYLVWLILSGNLSKFEKTLKQLTAQELDKQYPRLAAVLGLLILTRYPQWRALLPKDSTLCGHLATAESALQNEDLNSIGEALQTLPFRSALRDLRTVLKACNKATLSLADAGPILDKIPSNSPYSGAAGLVRICMRKGSLLAEEMSKLGSHQRRLVGEIIGLNQTQQKLIDTLSLQQGQLSDKVKFNLAIQFRSLFGAELSEQFCRALLNSYPAGAKDYKKNFGNLDEFENNRIKALNCELQHRYEEAEFYWDQCISLLKKEDGDNAVRIALILRRLAAHQDDPVLANQLLAESLEYDPEDKDSTLTILRFYGQSEATAGPYKQWLQKAETLFPQDIDLLTLVIEAAVRNRTYKKAVQYANKLLRIDPLNSFAKKTVISGHLNHARKQLKAKKYQLAEKELDQAEALRSGKQQSLPIQLLRALLLFACNDKTQGLAQIKETLAKLHADPLNMHFQAAVEAQQCGLPVATLLRALPAATDYRLSKTELSRLIQQFNDYGMEPDMREVLRKALDKIKAPLKKSLACLGKDDKLLLGFCEILYTLEHFELMRHCVKSVEKVWKEPIWLYYQTYAETNGDPARCDYRQLHCLRFNLDEAIKKKDQRAQVLIEQYLDRYDEIQRAPEMDRLLDMIEQNMGDDPIMQLFGHVPDKILDKIDHKMEALLKKISPERLVRDLLNSVDNNSNILVAIMNNPDLFTALMMLKAAGELKIDLNVSVEDVLEFFDANQPSENLFPFPF